MKKVLWGILILGLIILGFTACESDVKTKFETAYAVVSVAKDYTAKNEDGFYCSIISNFYKQNHLDVPIEIPFDEEQYYKYCELIELEDEKK